MRTFMPAFPIIFFVITFIVAYLFLLKSVTFILFDSAVCKDLGCSLGSGGYCGIVSSVCWFVTSLLAMRMYLYHKEVLLAMESEMRLEEDTSSRKSMSAITMSGKSTTSSTGTTKISI